MWYNGFTRYLHGVELPPGFSWVSNDVRSRLVGAFNNCPQITLLQMEKLPVTLHPTGNLASRAGSSGLESIRQQCRTLCNMVIDELSPSLRVSNPGMWCTWEATAMYDRRPIVSSTGALATTLNGQFWGAETAPKKAVDIPRWLLVPVLPLRRLSPPGIRLIRRSRLSSERSRWPGPAQNSNTTQSFARHQGACWQNTSATSATTR